MEYTVINIRFKDKEFDLKEVSLSIHKLLDSVSSTWTWIHTKIVKNVLVFKEGNRKNVKKFLNIKCFNVGNRNINVQFEENICLNNVDGVIYCRPILYRSDEYILNKLKNQNVVNLLRSKKKFPNGTVIETGLFFLTFKKKYKPDYISFDGLILPVSTSFRSEHHKQCKHCFKIGHETKNCFKQNGRLCPKCNKSVTEHITENCKIECVNCKENHLSSSCSVTRNYFAIQDINIKLLHQQEKLEVKSLGVERLYKKLHEINAKIRKYEKYCIIYGSG